MVVHMIPHIAIITTGNVSKIRLLGDSHHNTRIAFVEFEKAESAKAALNCSGALLGMYILGHI